MIISIEYFFIFLDRFRLSVECDQVCYYLKTTKLNILFTNDYNHKLNRFFVLYENKFDPNLQE